jgi:hypothetical protein
MNEYSFLTICTLTVATLLMLSSDVMTYEYYFFLKCFNLFVYCCYTPVLSLALCLLCQHISNEEGEMSALGRLSVSLYYDRLESHYTSPVPELRIRNL